MPDTTPSETPAEVAARVDHGRPSALKRGRNPKWPYVPVILFDGTPDSPRGRQEQILGRAFVTRDEAVEYAAAVIENRRNDLARKLAAPAQRALREWYGLPRELSDWRY